MLSLERETEIFVRQKRELAELFGFETRNKYEITRADRTLLAYAAEQGKGIMGMIGRQILGHWRSFELFLFTPDRRMIYRAVHPFRFYYQRLELHDAQGRFLGAAQKRFAFLYKRFDIEGPQGQVLCEMASAPWKIWTFPFKRHGREIAVLRKKWSGFLNEAFTDKDSFHIAYNDPSLSNDERLLILASAIFVDLLFFETKANQKSSLT